MTAQGLHEEAPPIQQTRELTPPADGFWLAEAITETTKPQPVRPRSISLGNIGDAPLSGGVMRDTPMELSAASAPPWPNPWQAPLQPAPRMCCR